MNQGPPAQPPLPPPPAWRILGPQVRRPGHAFGLDWPSLALTIAGEALDDAARDEFLRRLLAVPPLDALAPDPAVPAITATLPGFGGVVEVLLQLLLRLQRAVGMPVLQVGRIIALEPAQARVLLPAMPGTFVPLEQLTGWLVGACDGLRAGADLSGHLRELESLLARLGPVCTLARETRLFLAAAQDGGIPFALLREEVIELGQGRHARRLQVSFTGATSRIGARLARLKTSAAQVLREAGLPAPPHTLVADAENAVRAAEALGYPVVVKPADLDGGVAVSTDLATPAEVEAAYARARAHSDRVLVERHVPGRDYRLLVWRGKLTWALERVPGGVVGDGRSSVRELIARLNADPRRAPSPLAPLRPLPFDEEALEMLERAGLDGESVPVPGELVRLRRAANIASGGLPVGVMAQVHPDNARLAERAAAALELDLAGIDLLIPDIARSWLETGAAICEVNACPNLGELTSAHLYAELLGDLVPGDGRVPIVLILGAGADSAINLGSIARNGLVLARHGPDGVFVGNERLTPGVPSAFDGGRMALRDRRVEALVMAVADNGLLGSGLPFARFDLLVVAGETLAPAAGPARDEPLGKGRERMAAQLRLLLPACDGTVVPLAGINIPIERPERLSPARIMPHLAPDSLSALLADELPRLAAHHLATRSRGRSAAAASDEKRATVT